jgi:hypothetical protein
VITFVRGLADDGKLFGISVRSERLDQFLVEELLCGPA